jgi:hypothetical protein
LLKLLREKSEKFINMLTHTQPCAHTIIKNITKNLSLLIKYVVRRRWEDNIKMDLREIGFRDVDWIHWAQDRDRWRALGNTVMNLRVP